MEPMYFILESLMKKISIISWGEKITYPFKQGQSCFQRSLWPSKWKTVPVKARDWTFLWQSGLAPVQHMVVFHTYAYYLKCVIWFSRSTRSLSLISSKRSFSSAVTVPMPSGLRYIRFTSNKHVCSTIITLLFSADITETFKILLEMFISMIHFMKHSIEI